MTAGIRKVERTGLFGAVVLGLVLVLWGCGDTLGPLPGEDVRIEVTVSGGFAGVSYSFALDGADRTVRGLACTSGCDFDAGDVLTTISRAQVLRAADEMRAAGVLDLDGVDFGTLCCDSFAYELRYREGTRTSTVRGDSGTLPPRLLEALVRLVGVVDGRLPILVALEASPDSFPSDPLTIEAVQLVGDLLEASVSFGGGCASHEIDLVALGGWLESFPVQVDVILSHEDNDDPCDALLTESRSFDLRPLAAAYRESYGSGEPGETTLILRLSDPDEPSGVRLLEYDF